jgi:hypothetical protein
MNHEYKRRENHKVNFAKLRIIHFALVMAQPRNSEEITSNGTKPKSPISELLIASHVTIMAIM